MDLNKLKKIFKKKRVFITGHTGFKGIWLYIILNLLGSKIQGYSLRPNAHDNFTFYKTLKKLKNIKINSIYGDILDKKKLQKSISNFKPHILFHFAAQSLVINSQLDPLKTYETNVIGTENILSTCSNIKSLKSLVIATTDKCYLNNEKNNYFDEDSPLGGHEPYSSSKAISEILIKLYYKKIYKNLDLGLSSVRAGNVIGGGDFSEYRIIPDLYKYINQNKQLYLRNPNSIRPWQHVFDVVRAYLYISLNHLKNSKKYSGPYNIGPAGRSFINVKKLSQLFFKNINIKKSLKTKKKKFLESKYLFISSDKAKKKLNWKPIYNTDKTMYETVIWYKNFMKRKKNIYSISKKQILKYFNHL